MWKIGSHCEKYEFGLSIPPPISSLHLFVLHLFVLHLFVLHLFVLRLLIAYLYACCSRVSLFYVSF